jgi:Skp family chaperone for outer membrane proteins
MNPMKPITAHGLIICLILTVGYLSPAQAVTDAELEALEKQIEKLEAEEKQQIETTEKKKADADARLKAEQKRKTNAEAEKKRQTELEKQRIEEERRLAEEAKIREEGEKKKKYTKLVSEAKQAFNDKDKTLAIKKYNAALALSPGDIVATRGLVNAEGLKHKLCYDVLGKWIWDRAFGEEYIILHDGGSLDYQTSIKGSGSWECTSPETRTIKIRVSAAGFSNEWLSTYSEDGNCLLGPEGWGDRGCYHRPESGNKSEQIAPKNNPRSKIPGL